MMKLRKQMIYMQATLVASAFVGVTDAHATNFNGGNNFSDIAKNITDSIAMLPGLLTGVSYLLGLLLGVLGVLKVKDHVENPSQTPLKDGAIRMASGGALFALPIIYESMANTIGSTSSLVGPALVNPVSFNVNG